MCWLYLVSIDHFIIKYTFCVTQKIDTSFIWLVYFVISEIVYIKVDLNNSTDSCKMKNRVQNFTKRCLPSYTL